MLRLRHAAFDVQARRIALFDQIEATPETLSPFSTAATSRLAQSKCSLSCCEIFGAREPLHAYDCRTSAPITAKSQERRADQDNQEQGQNCCHSPGYQGEVAKPGRVAIFWKLPEVARSPFAAYSPHSWCRDLLNGGELRLAGRGSILFWEEAMGHLTLREALASRLEAFVREQQVNGAELVAGSELERGLALLVTQRRLLAGNSTSPTCCEFGH